MSEHPGPPNEQPDPDLAAPTPGSGGGRGEVPDGGPHNPPPPPPPAEQMVVLTAEITRIRRHTDSANRVATERHDQMRRALADGLAHNRRDTADLVAQLRRDTEDHFLETAGTLREHATAIERVLTNQQRGALPPVPWHTLNVADAQREWELLARWIDQVFVPWGEITRAELPDCWAMHRPVLVQLSWLRTLHVQAYRPNSDPVLAAEWHVRWSPAVLRKINQIINDDLCRPGEHLITQEESNRRRAAAQAQQGPSQPPSRRPGEPRPTLGAAQLATRQFWEAFYLQARDGDLRWRAAQTQEEPQRP
jgi:hypothetical protein